MRRRGRKWLVWGAVVALTLGALGLVATYVVYPRVGEWAIRTRVLPKIAARLSRTVTAASIEVEGSLAVIRGLVVQGPHDADDGPLGEVERIEIRFAPLSALSGTPTIHSVTATGATIRVLRDRDGVDNVSDIWLRTDRHGGSGRGLKFERVVASQISLFVDDHKTGVSLRSVGGSADRIADQAATLILRQVEVTTELGPKASAETVTLRGEPRAVASTATLAVAGGKLSIWRGLSLTGISGQVHPEDGGEKLSVDFVGGYGGVDGQLWASKGWFQRDGTAGELALDAERFKFARLRPLLADSPVIDFDDTEVDASFSLTLDADALTYQGKFAIEGLNVFHPMMASVPVRDLSATGDAHGRYDRKSKTLALSAARATSRGVDYLLDGTLALHGGVDSDGAPRKAPRLSAHLQLPQRTCQQVLDGIPPELAPKMQGFKVRGDFSARIDVEIDWADLQALVLDGSVGIRKCKVTQAPKEFDAKQWEESFTHEVWLGGDDYRQFVIGFENDDFVPIFDVSPFLLGSLMTTEDSAFYDHRGFIVREFRTALVKNLEAGYFKYGASSITMQLVKNVILHRDKTLARKFQELFFTWYIETVLSKDRLFEIYINAIEYGPGIYGIGPAARHYFGKHPRDLNAVESAFFSSILPNPKERYRQYCDDKLNRWTENKIARILALMVKRDRMSEEQLATSLGTPLVFDRSAFVSERACLKQIKDAVEALRVTPSETKP